MFNLNGDTCAVLNNAVTLVFISATFLLTSQISFLLQNSVPLLDSYPDIQFNQTGKILSLWGKKKLY